MRKAIEKSKIFEIIWLLKWPVCGLLFILFSAFSFFAVFLLPFIFVEAVIDIVMLLKSLFKRNRGLVVKYFVRLFAISLFILAVIYSGSVSRNEDKQSMELGDKIVSMIEDYKAKTGNYPSNYDSLPQEIKKIKPVNGGSFYYYYNTTKGSFEISFNSDVIMIICSRNNKDKDWGCDD